MALRELGTPLHEGPDRGRGGVEDGGAILGGDRPQPVLVGKIGRAFVEDARGLIRERAVDDVGVAGHPADIRRAPVDVALGVEVEDQAVRRGDRDQIAARG